ncbi:uncharacterized protein LOC113380506 [Ctenocephalides felis]|uniref:uncharacterized protein LOC113371395 n=1 Tax=Ctenocephalides felis TaxID=7515 RepID=UPI000E6E350E|nr:uncharacterized protein LOC113371395 [Ctenocephalides felis]XP_026475504.1 uncharacterized protein LOC113380506 [Ctenocephalides felis]
MPRQHGHFSCHKLHIPEFIPNDLQLWFALVEKAFASSNIHDEKEKYGLLVTRLDIRHSTKVRDLIINEPEEKPYSTLKATLISRLGTSEKSKLQLFMTDVDLVKAIWLSRLPVEIQPFLEVASGTQSIQEEGELADRLFINHSQQRVAVISDSQTSEIETKNADLRQMRQDIEAASKRLDKIQMFQKKKVSFRRRQDNLCWFHRRYGSHARRCISPCNFKSGNDTGVH